MGLAVDAEDQKADGNLPEQFIIVKFMDAAAGIEQKILSRRREPRTGTVIMLGDVDVERDLPDLCRESFPDPPQDQLRLGKNGHPLTRCGMKIDGPLTGHLPSGLPGKNGVPFVPQLAEFGIVGPGPPLHIDEERGFREVKIIVQMIDRVPLKQMLHRLREDFFDGDIQRPDGPMEVDHPEQIRTSLDEVNQGGEPTQVHGEPLFREEAVVNQSGDIKGLRIEPCHVGVTQDEVHIVNGIDAAEERSQLLEPARVSRFRGLRSPDQPRNLAGVELFQRLQLSVRITANSPNEVPENPFNNDSADVFVGHSELVEVVVIKEVPEWSVSHIVQEGSDASGAFDVRLGRAIGADLFQRVVPLVDDAGGQMHRPENVLKPSVFGTRKDPPCGLQLMNMPHPLHPGMINQLLFRDFIVRESRPGHKRDVSMNRVVSQAFCCKVSRHERSVFHILNLQIGGDSRHPPTIAVKAGDIALLQ